jgi:hypothetical protein
LTAVARTEHELTTPVALAQPDGLLNPDAVGWSRQPVQTCDLPRLWGRRKKWDYWCVTTETHLLSLTYADMDYLGLASAWFLDFESGLSLEYAIVSPLGLGFEQPTTVGGADIDWHGLGLTLNILEEADGTRLRTRFRKKGHTVDADIFVAMPTGHETLSVTVPWSERRYQFTSKHNTRPATGSLHVDGRPLEISAANEAFGTLDFGRGLWPYRSDWNWASASGHQHDRIIGLQFGGKWTDGTPSTENAICVDGRIHKISEDIVWTYDRTDFDAPWSLRTADSAAVDLTFTPFHQRATKVNGGVMATEVHQCFGHFAGRIVLPDVEPIAIDGLLGWAEEARWRW